MKSSKQMAFLERQQRKEYIKKNPKLIQEEVTVPENQVFKKETNKTNFTSFDKHKKDFNSS
jgi:hypothetical protein